MEGIENGGVIEASGPFAHTNWRAAKAGEPALGEREYPLFSDAEIVGE